MQFKSNESQNYHKEYRYSQYEKAHLRYLSC